MPNLPVVVLARHGETQWSLTGRHTGLTDVPLTPRGERNAARLAARLRGIAFDRILTSPLQRAHRTCELAGFAERATIDPDLVEWDYGECEGQTTPEIRRLRPDWQVFLHGCPGGESLEQISARADRVVSRLRATAGNSLLFSSGHFLRVLAARWCGWDASQGLHLYLTTAAVCALGYEHALDRPVLRLWNDDRHVGD